MIRLIYCTSDNATTPMVVIIYMITDGFTTAYIGGHYSDVPCILKGRYQW